MKVLICGDRYWEDREFMHAILSCFTPETEIIHGACRGADTNAGNIGRALGFSIQEFPADWDAFGKRAGYLRNKKMLEQGPDLVLAFHNDIENSRGTRMMARLAHEAGVPVLIFTSRGLDRIL